MALVALVVQDLVRQLQVLMAATEVMVGFLVLVVTVDLVALRHPVWAVMAAMVVMVVMQA